MLERKQSSSFMERRKRGGKMSLHSSKFMLFQNTVVANSEQNGKMKKGQASLSECFAVLYSFCICNCFWRLSLSLNLDSLLPSLTPSHIRPTAERCSFEVSGNKSSVFEGTLLNELSYSLQTNCINSSLMENEICKCKVKGEVQNVMSTRGWEVRS